MVTPPLDLIIHHNFEKVHSFCDFITEVFAVHGYTKEKNRKELAIMAAMNMNHKEFYQAMEDGQAILVDYWAPWCSYCRRINAAYDKVAQQYAGRVAVTKVNIDNEPILAEQAQIEVIPTLVLYRGGKPQGFIVAPESKAAIDAFLQEHLPQ